MQRLLILALVGFLAELVDGSLGMAYGLTTASLLLAFGIAPVLVSAAVHMAEIFTTAAAGLSHMRLGNVDKNIVKRLIIPGAIGAFIGAAVLSNLPGENVKPYIAIFMLLIGVNIIVRFAFKTKKQAPTGNANYSHKTFAPLGFIAGFLDSVGGGGWGPITTPVLLARDDIEPRKVIGSVDTSEFVVTLSATLGFMLSLGLSQVDFRLVLALVIGGVLAAPLAAWFVRIIPQRFLGILVGGIILLTNSHVILGSLEASNLISTLVYSTLGIAWLYSLFFYFLKTRKSEASTDSN